MKDVAFYFNFKFYEKVVERGELSGKAPYDAKAAYGAQVR